MGQSGRTIMKVASADARQTAAPSRVGAGTKIVLGLVLLILTACEQQQPAGPRYAEQPTVADQRTHYVFAVHPLYNPQLLHRKFAPLMGYLAAHIPGTAFDLDASNTYADYEVKLRQRGPHFALPNPYHAVLARDWGYHVIARMGNDEDFRGIFLVRKDSPIHAPADLKGKTVAYPAPTALAAAMMPQLYLQNHGVDVQTELDNQYVGTHDSAIMNAYLGKSAASATWQPAWAAFQKANPKEAVELKVIWQTPPLIQNAIIVRNDVPADVAARVATLLTTLQDSAEGRALLDAIDTTRFVISDDRQFDVVAAFLAEYQRKVKKSPP